jgi:hypothetical protein
VYALVVIVKRKRRVPYENLPIISLSLLELPLLDQPLAHCTAEIEGF